MLCQNCKLTKGATEATLQVWCPTWIGSENGPRHVCATCAQAFQPEHNPNATDGSFHWGDDAVAAFKSVELNIPRSDARYANARNMVVKGTPLPYLRYGRPFAFIVDGKVWLLADSNVLRLGTLEEVRERFPVLFPK